MKSLAKISDRSVRIHTGNRIARGKAGVAAGHTH